MIDNCDAMACGIAQHVFVVAHRLSATRDQTDSFRESMARQSDARHELNNDIMKDTLQVSKDCRH